MTKIFVKSGEDSFEAETEDEGAAPWLFRAFYIWIRRNIVTPENGEELIKRLENQNMELDAAVKQHDGV